MEMEFEILKQKYKRQNLEIIRINTIYATKIRNYEIRQNKLLQANIDLTMKLNKIKKMIKNCLSHYYEFKNEKYSVDSHKKEYLEKIFGTLYNIIIAIDNKKNLYNSIKDKTIVKNQSKKEKLFTLNSINDNNDINEYKESNLIKNNSKSLDLENFSYITQKNNIDSSLILSSPKPNVSNKSNKFDTPQKKSYFNPTRNDKFKKVSTLISDSFFDSDNPFLLPTNKYITTKAKNNLKNENDTSMIDKTKKLSPVSLNRKKEKENKKKEVYIETLDDIPIIVKKKDLRYNLSSASQSTESSISISISPSPPLSSSPQLSPYKKVRSNFVIGPFSTKKESSYSNDNNNDDEIDNNTISDDDNDDDSNDDDNYNNDDSDDDDNDDSNDDDNDDSNFNHSLYTISSDDSNNNNELNNKEQEEDIYHEKHKNLIDKNSINEYKNNDNKKNKNSDTNHNSNNNTIHKQSYNNNNTLNITKNSNNNYQINHSNKMKHSLKTISSSSNITKRKKIKIHNSIDIKTITSSNKKNISKIPLSSPYKSPIKHSIDKENINPNRRSHRHKNIVNYTLPSIRSKLRRGDKDYGCGIIRPLDNPYGINTFSHKDINEKEI
ncbi:hypothetical protein BCR32DRAFT_278829 [Anaeromyces robustus]|uniref:Uncharacterized protein n=1 Tax=Anaeromyces robustus TaxID=1754192 RepID=A0A1Y1X9V3_9FUNG|nr:hypothetical protein BCR32DRAFT_278829 [Anaeromyces robustus]|eukprot:ORX82518.1 hypothetical protein BCR32DRAFT_278829 [Anaeromyces robustus]